MRLLRLAMALIRANACVSFSLSASDIVCDVAACWQSESMDPNSVEKVPFL